MELRLFHLMMFLLAGVLVGASIELVTRLIGGRPATFLYTGSFRDRQTDWDVTYGITPTNQRVTCGVDQQQVLALRRVAVIGDSFVFGQGIPDCYDLTSRLQTMNTEFKFINYGVIGIGFSEYEMIVRDMIEPDVTDILLILYGNDVLEIDDSLSERLSRVSSAFSFIVKLNHLITAKYFTDQMLLNRTPVFNNIASVLEVNPEYFRGVAEPADGELRKLRTRLPELIRHLSALVPPQRIWIAVAPEATTVSETNRTFVQHLGGALPMFGRPGRAYDEISNVTKEEGANFIDLFPAFLSAKNVYFPHDLHWSPDGHLLAAQLINSYLGKPAADARRGP
jgi:hypothetical protein